MIQTRRGLIRSQVHLRGERLEKLPEERRLFRAAHVQTSTKKQLDPGAKRTWQSSGGERRERGERRLQNGEREKSSH